VWAVVVEVAYVLVEDGADVLFVVDQHSVGAFFTDAADEPFCITVGPRRAGRILIMSSPSEIKTASKLSEGSPAGVYSAWCWPEAGGGEDAADGPRAQAVP
jgi:hypothetical protein